MARVVVVWGPPASGKSTHVMTNLGDNDLVYDFDLLMRDISGLDIYDRNDNLISYLMGFRAQIVDRLADDETITTAWLIISFPSDEMRQRLDGLSAEYALIDTPKQTCIDRINGDDRRKDKAEWLRVVDDWFERYENEYGAKEGAKLGKKFWKLQAKKGAEKEGELLVYGPIDSESWWGDEVTPKVFKQELDALGDITILNIYINSFGGDVFAGQAIYSMLKRHSSKKVVYIDGLAASIASVIAMAGDTVIMPKNAMMMIHNPWTIAVGNANDFRKLADDLEKIGESLLGVYESKTGLARKTIEAYLDGETWFTAEEAVQLGFADEMEEEKQIAASIRIADSLENSRLIVNGTEFELSKFKQLPINKFAIDRPQNEPQQPQTPAEPQEPQEESPPEKRVFDIKRRVSMREKSHRRINP